MHFGAIKLIFEKAEHLRKNMTHEEKILWMYIANKQLGYKFRRQHPVWMYIADFYCHELKLVIEVDGGIHERIDVSENDAMREDNLTGLGIKVIRFTNAEIRCQIDKVLENIKAVIIDLKKMH